MAAGETETLLDGRYRLKRPLGRGGMATVYLAEDERLGREVAIKRLHADSPADMERRFTREAKVGASLNHPNLVWVFDTVTDDEGVYIVMEYVDGPTLAREVAGEPLGTRKTVEVIAAVAAALEHVHEEGIVHRDVKPANVLLGRRGVIKLADLGIAAVTTAEHTRITQSGVVLGTASYMAPEQLEGERVTPATDIYALATLAYECMTGSKARSGRTPMEVAHVITAKPPPDVRDTWPDAPPEAAEVIFRGMARDPSDRPQSACDLATDLAQALGEESTARMRLDVASVATGTAVGGAVAAAAAGGDTAESSPTVEPTPPRPPTRARQPDPPRQHTPAPAPRPPRRGQYAAPRRRWPAAALAGVLAAAVALVAVIVLASGGGGGEESSSPQPSNDQQAESTPESTAESPPPSSGDSTSEGGQAEAAGIPQPANKGGAAEGARLNREGFGLLNDGKSAEAVAVLRRSVEAFPPGTSDVQYAFALFNLGKALRLSGKPAEAVPVLERRLEIPNQTATVQKELDAARRDAG